MRVDQGPTSGILGIDGQDFGFVRRELNKIEAALHKPQQEERYRQLYAAQQALAWSLEPDGFASPYDVILSGRITGTQADSTDCSVVLRPPQS